MTGPVLVDPRPAEARRQLLYARRLAGPAPTVHTLSSELDGVEDDRATRKTDEEPPVVLLRRALAALASTVEHLMSRDEHVARLATLHAEVDEKGDGRLGHTELETRLWWMERVVCPVLALTVGLTLVLAVGPWLLLGLTLTFR